MAFAANRKRKREAHKRIHKVMSELYAKAKGMFISLREIARVAEAHFYTVKAALLTYVASEHVTPLEKKISSAPDVESDLANRSTCSPEPVAKTVLISYLNTGAGMSHISEIMKNLVKRQCNDQKNLS